MHLPLIGLQVAAVGAHAGEALERRRRQRSRQAQQRRAQRRRLPFDDVCLCLPCPFVAFRFALQGRIRFQDF